MERHHYGEISCNIWNALVNGEIPSSVWNDLAKHALTLSYEKLGDVAAARGKLDDAAHAYDDALATAMQLAEDDPSNTECKNRVEKLTRLRRAIASSNIDEPH